MGWKLAACSTGIVSLLIACSGADPNPRTGTGSAALQGSIAPGTRPLDNARAVAIRQDGKKYWSYLDARGAFALALPPGFSYRLLIANARAGGGLRTIGHFVATTPNGTARWVHLAPGQTLALGAMHPKGVLGGSHTQSEGEGGHGESSDGPSETHQDDVDEGDDDLHQGLCGEHDGDDDDDVDLQDDVDNAHDDIGDDSVEDHDSEDGDDAPCPPPPPPPPPPATGGGTVQVLQLPTSTPATPCKLNADCGGALVCVAAKCQFPTPY
jgi:hypothetical protein